MSDDKQPNTFAHQETPKPVKSPFAPPAVFEDEDTNPSMQAVSSHPDVPADRQYVRNMVGHVADELFRQASAARTRTGVWGFLAMLGAAVVAGFFAKTALAGDIKEKVDAGMVPMERRLTIVEQDQRHQAERIELANKKLDVVMDALRVPYDRRPAMLDGGQ